MSPDRKGRRSRELAWHRSTYSGSQGGNCVDVAVTTDVVYVRDSKCREDIPIASSPAAWSAFLGFAVGAAR